MNILGFRPFPTIVLFSMQRNKKCVQVNLEFSEFNIKHIKSFGKVNKAYYSIYGSKPFVIENTQPEIVRERKMYTLEIAYIYIIVGK